MSLGSAQTAVVMVRVHGLSVPRAASFRPTHVQHILTTPRAIAITPQSHSSRKQLSLHIRLLASLGYLASLAHSRYLASLFCTALPSNSDCIQGCLSTLQDLRNDASSVYCAIQEQALAANRWVRTVEKQVVQENGTLWACLKPCIPYYLD